MLSFNSWTSAANFFTERTQVLLAPYFQCEYIYSIWIVWMGLMHLMPFSIMLFCISEKHWIFFFFNSTQKWEIRPSFCFSFYGNRLLIWWRFATRGSGECFIDTGEVILHYVTTSYSSLPLSPCPPLFCWMFERLLNGKELPASAPPPPQSLHFKPIYKDFYYW